jgi:hypothetical protein
MSDIHITRELLRAVANGNLPPQVLVDYGYQHLMGLCGVCREEFAAFGESRLSSAMPVRPSRHSRPSSSTMICIWKTS